MEKFSLLADFLSGACLGAFISTIFYPLNTTKTHMQVSQSEDQQGHTDDFFFRKVSEENLKACYQSLVNY